MCIVKKMFQQIYEIHFVYLFNSIENYIIAHKVTPNSFLNIVFYKENQANISLCF